MRATFFENYRKSCPLTQSRVDTGLSCQLTLKRSSWTSQAQAFAGRRKKQFGQMQQVMLAP